MESIDWVALTRWVLLAGFGLAARIAQPAPTRPKK
jgi:hypothetical protein